MADRIRMGSVYRIVMETMNELGAPRADTLSDVLEADRHARAAAERILKQVEA